MTLVKPLQRWQYLLGKWVGIVLFDLLLVVVAGAGTYTFVSVLAATEASDAADRIALDREVLTSRVATAPLPSDPQSRDSAIAASIDRLEKDDPDAFARNPAAARRRIRQEYDWQWHTVTADMVSTFMFHGLRDARRRAAEDPEAKIQLQLRPRANNVDVDLADVRFTLWLNDRPWPVVDGQHSEQTLRTLAVTVLDLPASEITEDGVLKVAVANRNLVPAGETNPTAITFSPGDGMRVYHRVGGFAGNFLRALVVMWVKLSMLAAVGIAAAAGLGFPMAILASLVVYAAAMGSGFLRDALGRYNVVSVSWLAAFAERLQATLEYAVQLRFYEAFRMLYGFVTDAALWLIPSFSDFDAVGSLATGMAIDWATLLACVWRIGLLAPLVLGTIAWLTFDRRDLAGSTH
jgi:ABC-type transport system involved in multi-copper enzyme maturation permease subunit